MLKTRILHGDYSLKPVPSERKLAEEFGINFMTVRRSLRLLESEGFLVRQPNGRLSVAGGPAAGKRHFNLAMLMPAGGFQPIERSRIELEQAAQEFSASIRPVVYTHWNDSVLLESVSTFDGVFFYPFESDPPEELIQKFRAAKRPVVALDHDFSAFGIPSIQFYPPIFVSKLLDHLREQGHECVGCLNTQSSNTETLARIAQWRFWSRLHGNAGRLVDQPVAFQGSTGHKAREVMRETLATQPGPETAWFCVTMGAALGLLRAMADLNLRPGTDLSVCVVNGAGLADLLVPSITALEQPDMLPYYKYVLDWMTSGGVEWEGPLLVSPVDAELIVRESTAAPLSSRRRKTL